jgi:hypothetical protein
VNSTSNGAVRTGALIIMITIFFLLFLPISKLFLLLSNLLLLLLPTAAVSDVEFTRL